MFLTDMRDYLQANGISGTLSYSKMPDIPDDAVCVYEYAGRPPEWSHSGMEWSEPGLQVKARSKDYATARAKIESIFQLLKNTTNITLSGTNYLRIEPVQSPFPLGPDQNGREVLAVNFIARKQEV